MIYLATAVSLVLFVWSLRWSRAVETAGNAVKFARSAMATLFDATLSDDEKERAARASSRRLAIDAVMILARLAMAIAVPLAFFALLIVVRVISLAPLLIMLESWTFIAASTIAIGAALIWQR